MFRILEAGDRVRVASRTSYEPMAALLRAAHPNEVFIVEKADTVQYGLKRSEVEAYHVVQIQYPDGSLSGAIYAEIFEKVPDTDTMLL